MDLPEESTHVEEVAVPQKPSEHRRAWLVVLSGMMRGEQFPLETDVVRLGRGDLVDVRVADHDVSREHAQIRRAAGGHILEDAGSSNGTFCNGTRVQSVQLRDGDKIQLGAKSVLRFNLNDNFDEQFQEHMRQSAIRDGLTGAYNRRYLFERIEAELSFWHRHKSPFSLIMMDVDHFKRVNDEHGHLAGDAVLAGIAARITSAKRQEDVFARYGGEELALLCRGTPVVGALRLAERVRNVVGQTPFPFEAQNLPVTLSLGVASLPESNARDAAELIRCADEALLEAKQAGRNRIVIFESRVGTTSTI